jgi:hypothetical protein
MLLQPIELCVDPCESGAQIDTRRSAKPSQAARQF